MFFFLWGLIYIIITLQNLGPQDLADGMQVVYPRWLRNPGDTAVHRIRMTGSGNWQTLLLVHRAHFYKPDLKNLHSK